MSFVDWEHNSKADTYRMTIVGHDLRRDILNLDIRRGALEWFSMEIYGHLVCGTLNKENVYEVGSFMSSQKIYNLSSVKKLFAVFAKNNPMIALLVNNFTPEVGAFEYRFIKRLLPL